MLHSHDDSKPPLATHLLLGRSRCESQMPALPKNVGFAVTRDTEHNRGIPRVSAFRDSHVGNQIPGISSERRFSGLEVQRPIRSSSIRPTRDGEDRATTVFRVSPSGSGLMELSEARLRSTKATE